MSTIRLTPDHITFALKNICLLCVVKLAFTILHSIEIDSEGCDSNEKLFLDNGYKTHIVILLIPELSRAHSNSLTVVVADYGLHAVLVPLIFVKRFQCVLRLVGKVSSHLG